MYVCTVYVYAGNVLYVIEVRFFGGLCIITVCMLSMYCMCTYLLQHPVRLEEKCMCYLYCIYMFVCVYVCKATY